MKKSYKKLIPYFSAVLFFLIIVFLVSAMKLNELRWKEQTYLKFKVENLAIENDCMPYNIEMKNLREDSALFTWKDDNSSSWEYYVSMNGTPKGGGNITSTKNISVNRVTGGALLQPNTDYEFYIRSNCGAHNEFSEWIGPFYFRTLCNSATIPFWEGFNTGSTTSDCWRIIDNNHDRNDVITSIIGNSWQLRSSMYGGDVYEGDWGMMFYGEAGVVTKSHDDYLISPTFNLDNTKYYRLKYHYKTNSSFKPNDFDVLLSNNGFDVEEFTTLLTSKKEESSDFWTEDKIIIGGIKGNINLAWHVISKGINRSYVHIDNVFLDEIDCPEPWDLDSKNEEENKATISWVDNFGTDWEYIVQKAGEIAPLLTTTGIATKSKENIVVKENNGTPFKRNTQYEFYVRNSCNSGNIAEWQGPYVFRTLCGVFPTPFWEGFNSGSVSMNCWTIVDVDNDLNGIWRWVSHANTVYEGNGGMGFSGGNLAKHDDWLISPVIEFKPGKKYRLKYNYRFLLMSKESTKDAAEFEVLLSNSGADYNKFNKIIIPNRSSVAINNNVYNKTWSEEYTFINDVYGDINIAWHVTPSKHTTGFQLNVDNVFIEEVEGCPEPLPSTLGAKDFESDKASIYWDDNFGASKWEYYVQEAGGKLLPSITGTATTKKLNVVFQDENGNVLKSNTDYEFYVRTDCGNGTYSIWSGPYQFTTACNNFVTPFWEGFNTKEKQYRCWTIIDGNGDASEDINGVMNAWAIESKTNSVIEGDQSMFFRDKDSRSVTKHDDWLISPTIKMNNTLYMLKYRYRSNTVAAWEILMSSQGIDTTKFVSTAVSMQTYAVGREEVAFFNGITGDINLAWHLSSVGYHYIYLDDITIKEVKTCPEPYYVKVTSTDTSSISIEWQQYGIITSWEVIVVDYGEDVTSTPIQTVPVIGTPETTITGLPSGKAYTIYVRAKCTDGKSNSDWSTSVTGITHVEINDDCNGAIDIPVNEGKECIKKVSGTLLGAVAPTTVFTGCGYNDRLLLNDVWFEFVATSSIHLLTISDIISTPLVDGSLYGAIYDQNCNNIGTSPINCFEAEANQGNPSKVLLRDMIPGHKYYIRLGNYDRKDRSGLIIIQRPDHTFKLCITSATENDYLNVSPSGDKYTVEELIKEVFVNSNCNLVSNVRYQNGDGGPTTNKVNTLGYFDRGEATFPFETGIVLSTGPIEYVSGPYRGNEHTYNPRLRGANESRWIGDKDLIDAINDAGGKPELNMNMRVTQVEFDFIPIKDSIGFEYLFASNSYAGCQYNCQNGALFAAWLIDTTTAKGTNLAKIQGTDIPISLYTIWDSKKIIGSNCTNNPDFFGEYYDYFGSPSSPIAAPIDFAGSTIAMRSEKISVVPGRKYHIKLAVMDFCGTLAHTSAVFFNARGFDLGSIDLGPDLLVEDNTALCKGNYKVIKSGIALSEELALNIEWYKDGVLLPEENKPDLKITESGEYEIRIKFIDLKCESKGFIFVEIYPLISETVHQAETIVVCQKSLQEIVVDLTVVETAMFAAVDRSIYTTGYYKTAANAEEAENAIFDVKNYVLGKQPQVQTVYIRIKNTATGCHEVFELHIQPEEGAVPDQLESVRVCAEYIFPEIEGIQHYYTESGGAGKAYKAGDILAEPGEHTIYLLQVNSDDGCYEETVYQVNITAPVMADIFEDKTLSCKYYELAPLSEHNSYYTEPEGQGTELYEGMQILHKQTVYVYASSEDGLCTDESSFTIDYEDCPIPRGISPNGDGNNDTFDLSVHGVEDIKIYNRWGTEVYSHGTGYTDEWYGQSKDGKQLPDGTYYYVIYAHGKIRTGWVQINK